MAVSTAPSDAAERLLLALDLFEFGTEMMRQKLRREHPGASAEELEALYRAWLRTRPGAEQGDAEGRPVAWPRRRR
jgi:hypothetical protein